MPPGPLEVVERPDLIQRRQLACGKVCPEQVCTRVREVDKGPDGGHARRKRGDPDDKVGVHGR